MTPWGSPWQLPYKDPNSRKIFCETPTDFAKKGISQEDLRLAERVHVFKSSSTLAELAHWNRDNSLSEKIEIQFNTMQYICNAGHCKFCLIVGVGTIQYTALLI